MLEILLNFMIDMFINFKFKCLYSQSDLYYNIFHTTKNNLMMKQIINQKHNCAQFQHIQQNYNDNDTDQCSSCHELPQNISPQFNKLQIFSAQFEDCPLFNPYFKLFDQETSNELFESNKLYQLFPRTQDQVRHSYIYKLPHFNRAFSCETEQKHKHLFVFDWDDTILCTSHLKHCNNPQSNQKMIPMFENLDVNAQKILESATQFGEVIIITNAARGWVQYSGKKFMPKTFALLQKQKVKIISARSEYAQVYPEKMNQWKKNAFRAIYRQENNHLLMNIICVGDSDWQLEAGKDLAKMYQKSLLKTVKFRQNPRVNQLVKQQQLLYNKFDKIVKAKKNLTIRLEKVNIAQKSN